MTLEQTKEIVETIKTLNINFNDATTQKIAEEVTPIFKMYFFRLILSDVLFFIGVVGLGLFISTLIYKIISKGLDAENK